MNKKWVTKITQVCGLKIWKKLKRMLKLPGKHPMNTKTSSKKMNVVGVDAGNKIKDGEDTGEPCITVLVSRRVPESELVKNW